MLFRLTRSISDQQSPQLNPKRRMSEDYIFNSEALLPSTKETQIVLKVPWPTIFNPISLVTRTKLEL